MQTHTHNTHRSPSPLRDRGVQVQRAGAAHPAGEIVRLSLSHYLFVSGLFKFMRMSHARIKGGQEIHEASKPHTQNVKQCRSHYLYFCVTHAAPVLRSSSGGAASFHGPYQQPQTNPSRPTLSPFKPSSNPVSHVTHTHSHITHTASLTAQQQQHSVRPPIHPLTNHTQNTLSPNPHTPHNNLQNNNNNQQNRSGAAPSPHNSLHNNSLRNNNLQNNSAAAAANASHPSPSYVPPHAHQAGAAQQQVRF